MTTFGSLEYSKSLSHQRIVILSVLAKSLSHQRIVILSVLAKTIYVKLLLKKTQLTRTGDADFNRCL